jgi:hypothetical protein
MMSYGSSLFVSILILILQYDMDMKIHVNVHFHVTFWKGIKIILIWITYIYNDIMNYLKV